MLHLRTPARLSCEILANSSTISKAVLLILALFSIASWGIILLQAVDVPARSCASRRRFSTSSAAATSSRKCRRSAARSSDSPLVGLFQAGYAELTAQLRQNAPAADTATGSNPRGPAARPTLKSLTAVDRALMRASVVEVNKLEHRVTFLATTASITPFIGLFGTVCGHHHRVSKASRRPAPPTSASSRPAIADALVATADGSGRGDSGGVSTTTC